MQFYLEPRDRIKQLQGAAERLQGAAVKEKGRRGFFTTNIGQSVRLNGWRDKDVVVESEEQ